MTVLGVADGVAEAEAAGLVDITGVGLETISVVPWGVTVCSNLLLIQTKYPATTTNIKIIVTIKTFLFIDFYGSPPLRAGDLTFCKANRQASLILAEDQTLDKGAFLSLIMKIEAKSPLDTPSSVPPITSESQCSPK